jgi:hypothetical protein
VNRHCLFSFTGTPSYGTSLFVNAVPLDYTSYGKNVGLGANQPKGLFSTHDASGQCDTDACALAAAQTAQPTCPAAPMDYPATAAPYIAAAIAKGMPATVGKGFPAYDTRVLFSLVISLFKELDIYNLARSGVDIIETGWNLCVEIRV